MVARLSRIIPLLLVLAVVAAVIYLVTAYRTSPARGKEVLIKAFTVLNGALSAFFALGSLYAWFEGNGDVLDLTLTFLAAALVALAVTRVCNAVFLKHHPSYRVKPVRTTKARRFPWNRPR